MTEIVRYNSPLKNKIKIMQAAEDGNQIQCTVEDGRWIDIANTHPDSIRWCWDDTRYKYRIRPKEPLEFYVRLRSLDKVITLDRMDFTRRNLDITRIEAVMNDGFTYKIIKVKEILDDD